MMSSGGFFGSTSDKPSSHTSPTMERYTFQYGPTLFSNSSLSNNYTSTCLRCYQITCTCFSNENDFIDASPDHGRYLEVGVHDGEQHVSSPWLSPTEKVDGTEECLGLSRSVGMGPNPFHLGDLGSSLSSPFDCALYDAGEDDGASPEDGLKRSIGGSGMNDTGGARAVCDETITKPRGRRQHSFITKEPGIRCVLPRCRSKRTFRNEQALAAHQRSCHLPRQWRCPIAGCDKAFSSKTDMDRHRGTKRHRQPGQVLPFPCQRADCHAKVKEFYRKDKLKDHDQKYHSSQTHHLTNRYDYSNVSSNITTSQIPKPSNMSP